MPRLAVVVLSPLLLVAGVLLVADHEYGRTEPEIHLETTAPPPAAAAAEPTAPASTVPDRSGVPVQLVIPFGSSNHPGGVTAPVTADPLLPNGDLFVPPDPLTVSWASDDAMPGADRGTAILVGHVTFASVVGALSDLAEYAASAVGEVHRAARRRTAAELPGHRRRAVRQGPAGRRSRASARDLRPGEHVRGRRGHRPAGPGLVRRRLRPPDGNYEDNVFVFAMPVS